MSEMLYLGHGEARGQTDGQGASGRRQGPGYAEVGVGFPRLVLSCVLGPASPELEKR